MKKDKEKEEIIEESKEEKECGDELSAEEALSKKISELDC